MFPMIPMEAEIAAIRRKPPINLVRREVFFNDMFCDLDALIYGPRRPPASADEMPDKSRAVLAKL
jgi:hypothetical protein